MNAIFSRVSIRTYKDKKIKKKLVKKLLKAAMQAPSAKNQQPWEFIVVDKRSLLKELAGFSPYGKPVERAPLSIVLLMRTEGLDVPEFAPQDMGACAENMLLEATELGLGAVWQGVYPNAERVAFISQMFRLPARVVPFAVVSIGWPEKPREQVSRYDKSRVWNNHYIDREKVPQEIPEAMRPVDYDSVHLSQADFKASIDAVQAAVEQNAEAAEAERTREQERMAANQAAAQAAYAADGVFDESQEDADGQEA